jgi:hypothetical protein
MDEPSAGNGGGYIVPPAPIAPQPNIIDGYGNPAPELQREQSAPDEPTQTMPMLQNPDGQFEDQGIEVKANNKTEAENICQQIAQRRSDEWTVVSCLGCRMLTKTTGKFICTLRIESVNPSPTQLPEEGNE